LTGTGTITVRFPIQPIAMICYYPTVAVIAAAGYTSFCELYRKISNNGCLNDEYYSIVYVDHLGEIKRIDVPVWKVLSNSISEISKLRKRRHGW